MACKDATLGIDMGKVEVAVGLGDVVLDLSKILSELPGRLTLLDGREVEDVSIGTSKIAFTVNAACAGASSSSSGGGGGGPDDDSGGGSGGGGSDDGDGGGSGGGGSNGGGGGGGGGSGSGSDAKKKGKGGVIAGAVIGSIVAGAVLGAGRFYVYIKVILPQHTEASNMPASTSGSTGEGDTAVEQPDGTKTRNPVNAMLAEQALQAELTESERSNVPTA